VATTNDLRRYPRFNPSQPTFSAWQSANQRYVSRVGNLGLGGLFIRTPEPPPLGTLIQLLLDTSEGEIRARAEVKSTRPKEGMGVKIVAMQQDDRARFARPHYIRQSVEDGLILIGASSIGVQPGGERRTSDNRLFRFQDNCWRTCVGGNGGDNASR